jgi:hypothetical protein
MRSMPGSGPSCQFRRNHTSVKGGIEVDSLVVVTFRSATAYNHPPGTRDEGIESKIRH